MSAKRVNRSEKRRTVAAAIAALAEANINLVSVLGWAPQGVPQLSVETPTDATGVPEKLGIAWSGEQAEIVESANTPGALHTCRAEQGVNLRSLSGFGSAERRKSHVVWTAEKQVRSQVASRGGSAAA